MVCRFQSALHRQLECISWIVVIDLDLPAAPVGGVDSDLDEDDVVVAVAAAGNVLIALVR